MDAVIDKIANPDALLGQPGCEIVKDQPKTKVGCLQVTLGGRPLRLYIKRYNVAWRHWLGSLLMASGAVKAMRGAGVLKAAGIGTARPVAAVERRHWGMLTGSFYLTEEVAGSRISNRYWSEELQPLTGVVGMARRRAFLRGLAELFAKLHAKNIYHNDLKDFNILVAPTNAASGESFFLLDLEGVRRYGQISQRRRIKNLVQLNRTLGKLLSNTDRMRFLKCYLGARGLNSLESQALARPVIEQSRQLDRQKLAF